MSHSQRRRVGHVGRPQHYRACTATAPMPSCQRHLIRSPACGSRACPSCTCTCTYSAKPFMPRRMSMCPVAIQPCRFAGNGIIAEPSTSPPPRTPAPRQSRSPRRPWPTLRRSRARPIGWASDRTYRLAPPARRMGPPEPSATLSASAIQQTRVHVRPPRRFGHVALRIKRLNQKLLLLLFAPTAPPLGAQDQRRVRHAMLPTLFLTTL